jgi:ribose transport system ATP-binding protein
MVGRDVLSVQVYENHDIGDVVLEVDNLAIEHYLKGVSFKVRKGEILGFTGLLGDGRTELARAIFGDMKADSGTIKLNGEEIVNKSPEKAKKRRFGYVPANRKENGIIKDLTVTENITIATLESFQKALKVDHKRERDIAKKYVEGLRIKIPSIGSYITSLSGGNQQKAVIAKWLNSNPEVMIFSNPTQGVDVGAKNEIYGFIMELAKNGVAVIVTTGEAQEVQKICDRVCVMYHGEIKGELERHELSEESLMILSTGGSLN